MTRLDQIDAVILAGGLGMRLRAALPDRQKVMAPVAGGPFLARLVEALCDAGVRRIALALGYRAGDVTAWLGTLSVAGTELIASVEPSPLGTGGALHLAAGRLRSDRVLVLNGDSFAAADLGALVDFHRDRGALISLLACPAEDLSRFGAVEMDSIGAVTAFREKDAARQHPGYASAGVYVLERVVLESIPGDRPISLESEIFPEYCGAGLFAMIQDVPFLDIGTPESWQAADRFFASIRKAKGGQ